ncbi:uncharacterized protein B0I36DRAFT_319258 [Microdochium trichocladiopsis]|uniref:Aminoglycoside phosphotransferase domain-containing protein n=1 Tax=Microdochium trichocladiopsis TaxID=1682393 RepID=A0A9P8YD68_9PEZI|nr:uncharacterized protein B0I36DRAFT_319258 [Microdochium trichocladiopsis]KAH7035874.1 hypothetical protein B0I36DRAFT_319258 [Microdochium trichocladiopsis]
MQIVQRMLKLNARLVALQDVFWPAPESSPSSSLSSSSLRARARLPIPTFLWHDNLSADNLLVDEHGVLRGVLDWADVSCLPSHAACELPAVLQLQDGGRGHNDTAPPPVPPLLGTRGMFVWRAYYAELKRYEIVAMRELFVSLMRDLSATWTRAYDEAGLLRDMEAAIQNCDSEDTFEVVEGWVAGLEGGKVPGKDMKWLHQALWPV